MGFETISGTDVQYGLISFDADGKEISEQGTLMSQRLVDKARTDKVTNVFFFCHGWKGDVPAAKEQYGLWIKAFAKAGDRAKADTVFPNFRPLFIGLHWPSLPFGDEEVGAASFAAGAAVPGADALLRTYLERLGDSPKIRGPLEIIIKEARRNSSPDELPNHVRKAYLDLNDALGLQSDGVDAPPDADREGFDPEDSFEAGNEAGNAGGPASFGGGGIDLGGLLGPLRQLSYWTMKKRARTIGEGGMHDFLKKLQTATADSNTMIHLMGHSFGTIVVSGMLGGPDAAGRLPRYPCGAMRTTFPLAVRVRAISAASCRTARCWVPSLPRNQNMIARSAFSIHWPPASRVRSISPAHSPSSARSARSGCRACRTVRTSSSRCGGRRSPTSSSPARSITWTARSSSHTGTA
jgi:hypothetical protein